MKAFAPCLLFILIAALCPLTMAESQLQSDALTDTTADSVSENSAATDSLSGNNVAPDTLSENGAAVDSLSENSTAADTLSVENAAADSHLKTKTAVDSTCEKKTTGEKTLLATPVHHGIYGAPILKSASIGPGGTASMIAGAEVGWILNKKYVIALNVNGLATRVKAPPLPEISGLIFIVNYGGLYLSYIHDSNRLIHYEAGALVGLGQAFYRDNEYRARYNQIDAFVIIEPKIRLMLNVVPGFRLGAALSYRSVQRVDLLGLANKDLSGVSANLFLKLGRF